MTQAATPPTATDWPRVRRAANRAAGFHATLAVLFGSASYWIWWGTAPWDVHKVVPWIVVVALMSVALAASAILLGRWAATGRGRPAGAALVPVVVYAATLGAVVLAGALAGGIGPGTFTALGLLGLLFAAPIFETVKVVRAAPAAREVQAPTPMRARGAFAGFLVGLALLGALELTGPRWRGRPGSKISMFESVAIGSLRSLTTAQEQFKQQNCVDQDADGMGEYGWLGELAGGDAVRISGLKMNHSPFIAAILGIKDAQGFAQKSGYYFAAYLPTASGVAAGEAHVVDSAGNSADADGQEERWCVYAWPNNYPASGRRAFFVNHSGEVYATPMDKLVYTGTTSVPAADAAYERGTGRNLEGAVGLAAAGLTSNDGNTWVPVRN